MLGRLTGLYSKASTVFGFLPKLLRLRKIGRATGIAGLTIDVASAGIESLVQLSLGPFVKAVTLSLVGVNHSLTSNVGVLLSSPSGAAAGLAVAAIFGRVWFVWFLLNKLANYLEEVHLGDNHARFQILFISFMFLTLLTIIGDVMFQVGSTGSFTGEFNTPWKGLIVLGQNLDVVIGYVGDFAGSLPFVDTEVLTGYSGGVEENISEANSSIKFS